MGVWEAPITSPRGATALPPEAVGARGLAARRGGAIETMGEAGGALGEEVGSRGRGSDTEKNPPPVRFREAAPGFPCALFL